jgi:hypothetical protein
MINVQPDGLNPILQRKVHFMQFKRILILGKEALLFSGLLPHLQRQGELLIHKFDGLRIDDIVAEIKKIKPHAILMDDSFNSLIIDVFIKLPDDQKYHLIIINSKENTIQILDAQKVEISSIEDFINVL